MPLHTKLTPVRSYFEPNVFEWMERERKQLRRCSRSRFIEDSVIERLQRLGSDSSSHDKPRRLKKV